MGTRTICGPYNDNTSKPVQAVRPLATFIHGNEAIRQEAKRKTRGSFTDGERENLGIVAVRSEDGESREDATG